MLTNSGFRPLERHVKFVNYTGKYPNLCNGILTLEIDGKEEVFGYCQSRHGFWCSGGGCTAGYETYQGEWIIDVDEIPYEYQKYAREIDEVFNENVPYGCCGGCI